MLPCTTGGHIYNIVSSVDNSGFKFDQTISNDGMCASPEYQCRTTGPTGQRKPYREWINGSNRSYGGKL